MKSTELLSKSSPAEVDLSRIRDIGIICGSCGAETRARVSESTLRGVPMVCLQCQSAFADEREWLIASLEGLGEAVNYARLLRKTRIVLRSGT